MTYEISKIIWTREINRIKRFLDTFGWQVEIDFQLPVSGRIDYSQRLIRLNEPNALSAVITLAHEVGHLIHRRRMIRRRDPRANGQAHQPFREQGAYLYGWGFIRELGIPIDRHAWQDHHPEVLLSVDKS